MAGRARERSVLRSHLDALGEGRPYHSDVVLYGPRGNGKTVLLEWAVRYARSLAIRVISLSMGESEAQQSLLAGLSLLPGWAARLLRRFREARVPGFGIRMSDSEDGVLTRMLTRKACRRPLLLALDEAHRMDRVLGGDLLNIVQRLQRQDRPVTLILAGTPDLPRHLNTMDASFWDRCEDLPIGRLGPQDSADAVRVPFEAVGRSIPPKALDAVVRESCGYPFFLQLLGRTLWDGCPNPSEPISAGDVGRLLPVFQLRQRRFYGKRHEELEKAGLEPVAAAVAALFGDEERQAPGRVHQAVGASLKRSGRAAGREEVMEACEKLRDIGYIWRVYDGQIPAYEPGIPSLMGYVAAASKASVAYEDAWNRGGV